MLGKFIPTDIKRARLEHTPSFPHVIIINNYCIHRWIFIDHSVSHVTRKYFMYILQHSVLFGFLSLRSSKTNFCRPMDFGQNDWTFSSVYAVCRQQFNLLWRSLSIPEHSDYIFPTAIVDQIRFSLTKWRPDYCSLSLYQPLLPVSKLDPSHTVLVKIIKKKLLVLLIKEIINWIMK